MPRSGARQLYAEFVEHPIVKFDRQLAIIAVACFVKYLPIA